MRKYSSKKRALRFSLAVGSVAVMSVEARAQISISAPTGRVVVGTTTNTVFNLNNSGPSVVFNATLSPNNEFTFLGINGTPVIAGGDAQSGYLLNSVFNGSSTAVVTTSGVLAGAAGSTANIALNVTPTGGSTVTGTASYNLVDNRSFTGSINLGNLGRYMLDTATANTLAIAGDAQDNNHATQVAAAAGGVAYVNGFTISNATTFTYNGANQSHNFTIERTTAGSYNLSGYQLPASNPSGSSYGPPSSFGGTDEYYNGEIYNPLLTGESLAGSDFNLSGVSITAQGDAVTDRVIQSASVNIGRFMQNGPETSVVANNDLQLISYGSDDTTTRLQLEPFNFNQSGLQATMPTTTVFNTSTSATVHLQGTLPLNKSAIGAVYNTVSLGGQISALENLAGQNTQSTLTASTYYNIVNDNVITAQPVNVYTFGGDLSGYTFNNDTLTTVYGTTDHTALRLDSSFTLPNSTGRTVTITKAGGGIVGEGLAGENDESTYSYQANVVTLSHPNVSGTANNSVINVTNSSSSTLTVSNPGGSTTCDAIMYFSVSGDTNIFNIPQLPSYLDLQPGATKNYAISINQSYVPALPAGGFGLTFVAYVTANITDQFEGSLVNPASGTIFGYDNFSDSRAWTLQYNVSAPQSNTASLYLPADSTLRNKGVSLTSYDSTTASLIDSETLSAATTVSINFTNPANASSGFSGATGFNQISGDIATISGLDHVQQTVELSYNSSINALGIYWLDTTDNQWINSVLGDYNITNLNLSAGTLDVYGNPDTISDYLNSHVFYGSYGQYLLSVGGTAQLGEYGIDTADHEVWAVIDHNSSFAVVPEPATAMLLGIGSLALLGRRPRRR